MNVELTAGIVRILRPDGKTAGTGFVVHDNGLIATCAHVVQAAKAEPGECVRIVIHATGKDRRTRVEPGWWRNPGAEDVAVLYLEGPLPIGVISLPLGSADGTEGHPFRTFGYPSVGDYQGIPASGTIDGFAHKADGRQMLQLVSSNLAQGHSGAPILDLVHQHVVGIVTEVYHPGNTTKHHDTAFAIPVDELMKICSKLELCSMPAGLYGQSEPPLQGMASKTLSDNERRYLTRVIQRFAEWADYYVPMAGTAIETCADRPTRSTRSRRRFSLRPEYRELTVVEGSVKRFHLDDLLDAIDRYGCIALLGDSGSGKTTAAEFLAWCAAKKALEGQSHLPLLFYLSHFDPTSTVEKFVIEGWSQPIETGGWGEPEVAANLHGYLEEGRLFIILDALNEMPRLNYGEHVTQLRAFVDKWASRGNRFLITCRRSSFHERLRGLPQVEIEPLKDEQIKRLLSQELPDDWRVLWAEMQRGERQEQKLVEMFRNPYLLTMMIDIYDQQGGEIPANRGLLMERFSRTLLARERTKHDSEAWLSTEVQINSLAKLAYSLQERAEIGTAIEVKAAIAVMPKAMQVRPGWPSLPCSPERVLELAAGANILVTSSSEVRFYHQLLQEYFAAVEMQSRIERGVSSNVYWTDHWWELTGWEEATILLAGLTGDATKTVQWLSDSNPVLAAGCILDGGASVDAEIREGLRDVLTSLITDPCVPAKGRIAAGTELGRLGDRRKQVLSCEKLVWCDVPGGVFMMGDDLHSIEVPAFKISKYPVSVAQYDQFISDGGYSEREFWTEDGWAWRTKFHANGPDNDWPKDMILHNMPRIGVNWYEAMAFTSWFQTRFGLQASLPTEAQWEKAARGVDGRSFPWGNSFDANKCNSVLGDSFQLAPIGVWSQGTSPYGVEEMSGNIWEWCTTAYAADWLMPTSRFESPYAVDEREAIGLGLRATRIVKGGSYLRSLPSMHCSERAGYGQDRRSPDLGFRLVCNA